MFDDFSNTCASIRRPRSPPEKLAERCARLFARENRNSLHVADNMFGLPVDQDGIAAAAGQRFPDRDVRLETIPMLIKRRYRQIGSEAN